MIEWFKAIENKQHHSFICSDIVEVYPSISQDLLNKALDFASAYDNITNDERNIIIHAKNSILIHKQQAWQKKGDTIFDVTMGSYDGAQTCKLGHWFCIRSHQKVLTPKRSPVLSYILHYQARIHTGFHRFTGISQIFHYIFNTRTFHVEIWKIVYTNVFFFQFQGIRCPINESETREREL